MKDACEGASDSKGSENVEPVPVFEVLNYVLH